MCLKLGHVIKVENKNRKLSASKEYLQVWVSHDKMLGSDRYVSLLATESSFNSFRERAKQNREDIPELKNKYWKFWDNTVNFFKCLFNLPIKNIIYEYGEILPVENKLQKLNENSWYIATIVKFENSDIPILISNKDYQIIYERSKKNEEDLEPLCK
jgi:hypothetical protein